MVSGKRRCLRYKQVEVIDLEVNDETAAGNEIKADEPQTKRKPGRKKGSIGRKKKRQKQKECFISKSEKDTSFITPVVEKNQRRPGRPKKRKNRVMNRNNVPNDECSEEMFTSFEEEMKKYDELTIEVEKTPQSTSDDIIQSPSEAKKEVQYDWTDDETFSLIGKLGTFYQIFVAIISIFSINMDSISIPICHEILHTIITYDYTFHNI